MSNIVYVEAPNRVAAQTNDSLFLAGGITGCPDWQAEFVDNLRTRDIALTVYNPRRANFPISDPNAAEAQIAWEHMYLRKSDAVSFWFPKLGYQPIVLYELGAWSMARKPIFVGVEPGFWRQADVLIQVRLARPEIEIVHSLNDLAEQVHNWVDR